MLIAVPSDSPGGLEAPISDHFGHCDVFTLVRLTEDQIEEVTVVENSGHEQGGCLAPVMFLKQLQVDALLTGGMGMRPLAGFQKVGIAVHSKEEATVVGEAIRMFVGGRCPAFGEDHTCGGGGDHCGGHEPVERPPIDGPADVRAGRVVTLEYEFRNSDGSVIDSSVESGPMRYLHGWGAILPGIERGLAGLEPGAHRVIELPCEEAFGERDETRVIEVLRSQLPDDIRVGAMISGEGPRGERIPFSVLELGETVARLDGNHLLAGRDLVFEVTVLAVEAATEDELAHRNHG